MVYFKSITLLYIWHNLRDTVLIQKKDELILIENYMINV